METLNNRYERESDRIVKIFKPLRTQLIKKKEKGNSTEKPCIVVILEVYSNFISNKISLE
jgi:hypothetical protein